MSSASGAKPPSTLAIHKHSVPWLCQHQSAEVQGKCLAKARRDQDTFSNKRRNAYYAPEPLDGSGNGGQLSHNDGRAWTAHALGQGHRIGELPDDFATRRPRRFLHTDLSIVCNMGS